MHIEELRGKTEDELKALLVEQKKEAFNLRFQKSTGELENTSRIRTVRRTIAKIKTLLNNPEANKPTGKETKTKKAAPKKTAAKKTTKKAA